jgi:hypothetical protein
MFPTKDSGVVLTPVPSINGHLHYPNDLDSPINETADDKVRQYHTDYNNRPSLSPLFLIFLVRLVVYIVNLFFFYSYSLIGKLRKGSSFWFVYYEEIKGELKKILVGLFVMKRQRER